MRCFFLVLQFLNCEGKKRELFLLEKCRFWDGAKNIEFTNFFFTTQESCGRCFLNLMHFLHISSVLEKYMDGCGPFKTTWIVDIKTFLASEKFKSGLFFCFSFVLRFAKEQLSGSYWCKVWQVTSPVAPCNVPLFFICLLPKSASSEEKPLAPLFSLPLMWQYHPAVINPLWLQRTHWTP